LQQQDVLGAGKYGEVCRVTFDSKCYAGKTIYKKMLPGYPDVIPDDLKQLMKHIHAILPNTKHPNAEYIEAVIQKSPTSSPMFLSEILSNNLDLFVASMQGGLPIHLQVDLCQDMANGLAFLQETGITHTNLHGRNILISHKLKAIVADYICPQIISAADSVVIDQPYLAPEVIRGEELPSQWSAIFSLGVLFLQTITAHLPRPSDELELSETKRRMIDLQEVRSDHPLLSTIHQCLSDKRENRPPSNEVSTQIGRVKDNAQYVVSKLLQSNEVSTFVFAFHVKYVHN